MSNITSEDMICYSQRVIGSIFSNVDPKRELITPKVIAWAVYITEEMLVATALVTFFESCWKSTSYLSRNTMLMVKNSVALKYRSMVTGYFNQGVNVSDAERTYDDSDFIPQYGVSDRLRALGMKRNTANN
jgi:hypothetical protein